MEEEEDDHSLTTAINRSKDILLFWLLNKAYTLEQKVAELEKK